VLRGSASGGRIFRCGGLRINILQSLKEKGKTILIYFSTKKNFELLVVENLGVNPEMDSLNSPNPNRDSVNKYGTE
jgi:hypothetical protein